MAAMADDGCGLDDRLEHELGGGTVTPVVPHGAAWSGLLGRASERREPEPVPHGPGTQEPASFGPVGHAAQRRTPQRQIVPRQGTAPHGDVTRRDPVRDHAALHRAVAARFRDRVNAA